jgi:hypothetical protein
MAADRIRSMVAPATAVLDREDDAGGLFALEDLPRD